MPASPLYKTGKFMSRNRLGVGLAAALATIVVGAAAWLLDPRQTSELRPPGADNAIAAASAPAPREVKSLAVLPFIDASDRHENEYFADGLADALIDRLARRSDLRVIARTSAFAFKGSGDDLATIAARLGVGNVLAGRVRKEGGSVQVEAQLVRGADGARVWTQTYDRSLADIFSLQDEIVSAITQALQAAASAEPERMRRPNLDAYRLVLQGSVYSNGPFKRDAERAEVLFSKAASLDPGYALPWVALGLLHMKEARLAWAPAGAANEKARRAIEAALRIDPHSMAARAARFNYLLQVEHRWDEARLELDRMRAIDIRDPLLLPQCEAQMAGVSGNLDEAIKIQRQILDRDPLNAAAIGTLGLYLLHGNRFEESLALFRRELQLNPHAAGNHSLSGVALALLGRDGEAMSEIAAEQHEGLRLWGSSIAHWLAGRREESDAHIKVLLGKFPQASAYPIARVYALRGQAEPALDWLNRACAERHSGCEMLRSDRFFRGLHENPRFQAVLATMKLAEVSPRAAPDAATPRDHSSPAARRSTGRAHQSPSK